MLFAQLGAAGIKPEDLNFKSVTMDSGKFVCIRETGAKTIAIIDTSNPTNVQRMPAPVELACVHADGNSLVLCAAQHVQIYNVGSKEKIQAAALPEPAVFCRWIDEKVRDPPSVPSLCRGQRRPADLTDGRMVHLVSDPWPRHQHRRLPLGPRWR